MVRCGGVGRGQGWNGADAEWAAAEVPELKSGGEMTWHDGQEYNPVGKAASTEAMIHGGGYFPGTGIKKISSHSFWTQNGGGGEFPSPGFIGGGAAGGIAGGVIGGAAGGVAGAVGGGLTGGVIGGIKSFRYWPPQQHLKKLVVPLTAKKGGDAVSPPKQALGKPPSFSFPQAPGPIPTITLPKGPWKGIYLVYPPIDLRLAPTKVKWDTL
ncbi:hypothetical protein HPB49_019370 [Dermacentor silvarum]|uniref:Uncharacterized protein n=1 Tax=Dermacentor silvarum TaxID=543639 RepID=A0ACB8CH35_DERSI|nr:hypothetical protein HPB49_019370 [Dermacentor silvarum]